MKEYYALIRDFSNGELFVYIKMVQGYSVKNVKEKLREIGYDVRVVMSLKTLLKYKSLPPYIFCTAYHAYGEEGLAIKNYQLN
jgi:hypothetical protein